MYKYIHYHNIQITYSDNIAGIIEQNQQINAIGIEI